jgi:phosphatidylserine synthase
VMALIAAALVGLGAKNLELDRQWRWTWGLTLAVAAGLLVAAFYAPHERSWGWHREFTPVNAGTALALFVFCLLQIQVGLQERSTFLVNLGIAFIALDIIAAYLGLFGTMAFTGMMFVVSGIFLILFGVYLEKKRRKLMKQIKAAKVVTEVAS